MCPQCKESNTGSCFLNLTFNKEKIPPFQLIPSSQWPDLSLLYICTEGNDKIFQFLPNVNLKKHPNRKQLPQGSMGDVNLILGAVSTSLTATSMVLLSLENTWELLARGCWGGWVTPSWKQAMKKPLIPRKKRAAWKETLPGAESDPASFVPLGAGPWKVWGVIFGKRRSHKTSPALLVFHLAPPKQEEQIRSGQIHVFS